MNNPDNFRNIQSLYLQQQQFNQQPQQQFFEQNQPQPNQEIFQGHDQHNLQQINGLAQRNDERQQQLLQQSLHQQIGTNQNSLYDPQSKQFQALLNQQSNNNRQGQTQQPPQTFQSLNGGALAQSLAINQPQHFMQNNKNFFAPGQQQQIQQQQQNQHLDLNSIQNQSLLQLQMQQKNMVPNIQQQNALMNHYYQQQGTLAQTPKNPIQSQLESQDQLRSLNVQSQQIPVQNVQSRDQLMQQQFNAQNLILQQRNPATPSTLQSQIIAQNPAAQTIKQQPGIQNPNNLLLQQQNQQQMQQIFKSQQQSQLQQNKEPSQGQFPQQQSYPYQNQIQNQQNLVGQISSTVNQSPHLTQQPLNKQVFNPKPNEVVQPAQAQALQNNYGQRPTLQNNLPLMTPNNMQIQQQLLNQQSTVVQQKLQQLQQYPFQQQQTAVQQQLQQQPDVKPETQNIQGLYNPNQQRQQQFNQQNPPNNLSQNIHQQNFLNIMGQQPAPKDQNANLALQQQQIQQQLQTNNASQIQNNPQLTNQQLISAMATQQNASNQFKPQVPFNQQLPQTFNQQNPAPIQQQQQVRPQAQNTAENDADANNQTQNMLMQQLFPFQSSNDITQNQNQKGADNFNNQTIASIGLNPANLKLTGDANSQISFHNYGKLAEFCATRGDYPLAIEYYKHMTNLQPENGPSWMALGHCCLLTDEIHQAFNAYQHALNCVDDIKDPQLWYGIGILYEKFESYDNAISALVGVLKMSPNFYQKSEVLYKLGIIFAKTNQINQAINYFQNSILTNSFTNKRKVDTLLKIGLLYEEKRDFVQAQRSYEAALSNNDKNYKIYQHLAWCNLQNQNIQATLDWISKAEKREKDNADSFYIKARCYHSFNKLHEALENYNFAIEKSPTEQIYLISQAILLYQQGNYTGSFDTIIKAQTLKPDNPIVWYNLGILYEKCNQPTEALVAYNRAIEIDVNHAEANNRIMFINSQNYRIEMQRNPNYRNLTMIHPNFNVPNTLQILKKKKSDEYSDGQSSPSPIAPADQQIAGQNNPSQAQINQYIQLQQAQSQLPIAQQLPEQQQIIRPELAQNNNNQINENRQSNLQILMPNAQAQAQLQNQNQMQLLQQQFDQQVQHQQVQHQQVQQQQVQHQQVQHQPVQHQQQPLQIIQQTQRVSQPQQINNQSYSVRLPAQVNASQEQSLKYSEVNKAEVPQNNYGEIQLPVQSQIEKPAQNTHFQILGQTSAAPQPENQGNVQLDWDKLRRMQQAHDDQKQISQQQFNQNQDPPLNPIEEKKPEAAPEVVNHVQEEVSLEKPRFNFNVPNNNLQKREEEPKNDGRELNVNYLQNTYTQFMRLNQQNINHQQIQQKPVEQVQHVQQTQQRPAQTQGNFTILQQHSVIKANNSYNPQPQQHQQHQQPQPQQSRTELPEADHKEKEADQMTQILHKQKIYQQYKQIPQQEAQPEAEQELKKLEPQVAEQQEDNYNGQMQQLLTNQQKHFGPNLNEQIQILQGQIQANHRMNQNKYKSQISPEILAKKLNEVVKEANEEQNKDAQETKDEQLNTQLQQQHYKFTFQHLQQQDLHKNGPGEYDDKDQQQDNQQQQNKFHMN